MDLRAEVNKLANTALDDGQRLAFNTAEQLCLKMAEELSRHRLHAAASGAKQCAEVIAQFRDGHLQSSAAPHEQGGKDA